VADKAGKETALRPTPIAIHHNANMSRHTLKLVCD
jgi:hypothetical protein